MLSALGGTLLITLLTTIVVGIVAKLIFAE